MTQLAEQITTIQHFINGAETAGAGERSQSVYNPATGGSPESSAWRTGRI